MEVVWKISGDPERLKNPTSVAVNEHGDVYVLDAGNDRVQVFDRDGKFVRVLGRTGAGDGEFDFERGPADWIGGVALDAKGNVYVADNANQRIQKFDGTGKFLLKWGTEGTGDGQFTSPIDLAVDSKGVVYVVDDRRNDIQAFDAKGKFLLKWGGPGAGAGQLTNSGGIAVDGQDDVYVADFGRNRVQRFDRDGKFLLTWGSKGGGDDEFDGPSDLAVDAQGNVYVTNLVPHEETPPRVQKFDSGGQFLARWGSLGSGDGQFISPVGIAVDDDGNIYVTDADANNVQKFHPK